MKKLLIGIVIGFCFLFSFSMAEEMQRIDSDPLSLTSVASFSRISSLVM